MNFFKVSIVGGSDLSHDQIGDAFMNDIVKYIEERIGGEVSASFVPTDEYGELLRPRRVSMPRMYHGTTHL